MLKRRWPQGWGTLTCHRPPLWPSCRASSSSLRRCNWPSCSAFSTRPSSYVPRLYTTDKEPSRRQRGIRAGSCSSFSLRALTLRPNAEHGATQHLGSIQRRQILLLRRGRLSPYVERGATCVGPPERRLRAQDHPPRLRGHLPRRLTGVCARADDAAAHHLSRHARRGRRRTAHLGSHRASPHRSFRPAHTHLCLATDRLGHCVAQGPRQVPGCVRKKPHFSPTTSLTPRDAGLTEATILVGNGVGPILGGVMVEKLSWRWVFWISESRFARFFSCGDPAPSPSRLLAPQVSLPLGTLLALHHH